MKKIQLTLIITLIILSGIILFVPIHRNISSVRQPASSVAENIEKQPKYTVRVYQNVLAIYRAGDTQPWKITDIRLSSLKEYDRKLMLSGFDLYSDEDLTVFLEDYGS